jgi:hypothetical protein
MSDERGTVVLADGNERPATEAAAGPADEEEDL